MIVRMADLMREAQQNGGGVVCFESFSMEQIAWTVNAAEETGRPAALMLAADMTFFTAPRVYMAMVRALAEDSQARIAFVLSNCHSRVEAEAAMDAGFPSVVFDTSELPNGQAIPALADFTAAAHARGVDVTGVAGKTYTAEQAAALVRETGIDALEIAVMVEAPENNRDFNATCHWYPENRAWLDFERLAAVHRLTGVPLALNGCHNVPAEQFKRALAYGVARVDDGCPSDTAYAAAIKRYCDATSCAPSWFGCCLSIEEEVKAYLRERLRMLG